MKALPSIQQENFKRLLMDWAEIWNFTTHLNRLKYFSTPNSSKTLGMNQKLFTIPNKKPQN